MGPRREPGLDLFEAHQIAEGRAIFEHVILGRTIAFIARERGAPTREVGKTFVRYVQESLLSHSDPFFAQRHPQAVALRAGQGLPAAVRRHAALYLALADRLDDMVVLRDRMRTLDAADLLAIEITSGVVFPPHLQHRFRTAGMRTLGDLLDRSTRDLRQAGYDAHEVGVVSDMLKRYELRLRNWIRTPYTTGLPSSDMLTFADLRLTRRTLDYLKNIGIDSVDKLLGTSEQGLASRAFMGRRSLDELKAGLAVHGLGWPTRTGG